MRCNLTWDGCYLESRYGANTNCIWVGWLVDLSVAWHGVGGLFSYAGTYFSQGLAGSTEGMQ
jgi:hypothetical protein